MFKKTILFVATAGILVGAVGCSSSTSTATNTPDASSGGTDSGSPGTGPTGSDAGSGEGTDSGSPGQGDSGAPVDSAAPPPACLTAATGYTPLTASPTPKADLGLCTTTAISDFVTACGDKGTGPLCDAWQAANVAGGEADGGGVGNACGNCIFPADSTGAATNVGPTYVIPGTNSFGVNYGACVQIVDKTNGAACALALDNANACDNAACGTCSSNATANACTTIADGTGGACATPATAESSACASDVATGGALTTCSPGASTGAQDPDWTLIINLICGNGDAG